MFTLLVRLCKLPALFRHARRYLLVSYALLLLVSHAIYVIQSFRRCLELFIDSVSSFMSAAAIVPSAAFKDAAQYLSNASSLSKVSNATKLEVHVPLYYLNEDS